MADLPLDDIQGYILRGYRYDVSRHIVAHCDGPGSDPRGFLAAIVPHVTTAQSWKKVPPYTKPPFTLNVGITYAGLQALGVDGTTLGSFPTSFVLGATSPATAATVGDFGASAPANWAGGLGNADTAHVILTIYACDTATLDAATATWTGELTAHGMSAPYAIDATALPDNKVHFGYRDSIAQPRIDGAPTRKHDRPDHQPISPAGEFLMGHPSQNGITYAVAQPELTVNSSFGAFRILEQDVAAFETFLTTAAAATKLDRELIAAKVCGRWRSGEPLVLKPTSASPAVPDHELNDFHYGSADPTAPDPLGLKCPIGSHIRRSNPRDQNVLMTPDSGHLHRLVRRAMPYGPAYTGDGEPDGIARGLVGFFINVDLQNQFEFIMSSWIDTRTFLRSVPLGKNNPLFNITGTDVLLGSTPSAFYLTQIAQPKVNNVKVAVPERFITTKGGAYCYLPSITALTYLSKLTPAT